MKDRPVYRRRVAGPLPPTRRQLELAQLSADEGLTTYQMARRLGRAEDTIKNRRYFLMKTLRVGSWTEAVVELYRRGLVH